MGNNKSKPDHDIVKDISYKISKVNKVTMSELFCKKTGFLILFTYKENIPIHFFDLPPIIIAHVQSTSEKEVRLNTINFLNLYSVIMKSIPLFMELAKGRDSNKKDDNDETQCCICEVNKSNVLLDCMHSFCSNCLDVWLFQKKNDCPFCRKIIDLNSYDKDSWDIVDFNETNKKEYIDNANTELNNEMCKLLNNKY